MTTRSTIRSCVQAILTCGPLALAGCAATPMANAPQTSATPSTSRSNQTSLQAPQSVAANDPDLLLFGADPAAQTAAGRAADQPPPVTTASARYAVAELPPVQRARPTLSVQQQTFPEVGRDFDPDLDAAGRLVVFASTRHSPRPNLYIQSTRGRAVTQLTDDPGSEIQPRFSPDGKRVAFASDRNGQWDIFILDLEHRTTTQVTRSQDHELTPAWSPDGKLLAYGRLSSMSSQWELWMVSLEDREERCIGQGLMPRFSPDGSHIAYQKPRERDGRLFSIWTVKLTDGEPSWPAEIAAEPEAALICPAWSPDGQRIAYCRVPVGGLTSDASSQPTRPSLADLYIVEADGSDQTRVIAGGANFGPCWSAEGKIFFSADRDGREQIWSLRIAAPGKSNLASTAMSELP